MSQNNPTQEKIAEAIAFLTASADKIGDIAGELCDLPFEPPGTEAIVEACHALADLIYAHWQGCRAMLNEAEK